MPLCALVMYANLFPFILVRFLKYLYSLFLLINMLLQFDMKIVNQMNTLTLLRILYMVGASAHDFIGEPALGA